MTLKVDSFLGENVFSINTLNTKNNTVEIKRDSLIAEENKRACLGDVKYDDVEVVDLKARNYKYTQIEKSISTLQTADLALGKQTEILKRMENKILDVDEYSLSRDELVNIQEDLIRDIDEINKISTNVTFESETLLDGTYKGNEYIKNIERSDSQTLGLTSENISKLQLDEVRVAGENYIPAYSFDISTIGGSRTALTVVQNAMTKIDSMKREVMTNIEDLVEYPQILQLDHFEYANEHDKIRNVELARMEVARIKNSISNKIREVQNQVKNDNVTNLIDAR